MFAYRVILAAFLTIVTGCASMMMTTPQISLDSNDRKMEVKSEVSAVGVLDYSPDGKYLVSGGLRPSLRVWDVANAKGARIIPFPVEYGVSDVAYSPDGKVLAASGRNNMLSGDITKLWNAGTGQEIRTIGGDFGLQLSFSPDGKLLSGTAQSGNIFNIIYTTKLADTQTGKVLRVFDGYDLGAISPDGRYIALVPSMFSSDNEGLRLLDIKTGREIWHKTDLRADAVVFPPNSKFILASRSEFKGILGNEAVISIVSLDIATGNQTKEIVRFTVPGTFLSHKKEYQKINNLTVSPDGALVLSGNMFGEYKLWDIATGALIRQLKRPDEKIIMGMSPAHAAFSPNGKLVAIASAASLRLFNVASGDEVAAMIAFDDGEWLVTTPSGYYNSSEKGDEYLSVSVNGQPFSISQLRESFFRPDLVKVSLAGGSLKKLKKVADVKPPPVVAIVDTPKSIDKNETPVTLKITDAGGGVGDIRLYLNGSAVMLDSARSVNVVASNQNEIYKTYTLKLSNGVNTIRAIAFNADNTMQSTDAIQEIAASYQSVGRPSLYALVIGINEYKNPKLQLNYAVADATLFADTLKKGALSLFDKVEVKTLSSKEDTTRENILKELKAMQSLNPDDLFVLYVASHGTVDDGEYFLITSNVGSTRTKRLKTDAIGQSVIKELIGNIHATKKLIIIDTCNAGALGDAIQVALLTRGMSEDTAMKILSRAVGSTILSASTSLQEALEGYQGHGLFTYVLAEGLKGKADKGNTGYVKTTELADYVDNEVPALAEKIYKKAQYPTISISGQAFPIGKVR